MYIDIVRENRDSKYKALVYYNGELQRFKGSIMFLANIIKTTYKNTKDYHNGEVYLNTLGYGLAIGDVFDEIDFNYKKLKIRTIFSE